MQGGRKADIHHLRNIGIMAHIDAGKTTTTERMLYYSGKVHRIGEVDDGTATMDWMEQEKERGITITSAAISFLWRKHQINLIDTPGHVDFTMEVERSLRVLDSAVAIFCAVGGVEPQSETVWRQADKYHIPRLTFINKMDRVGADFYRAVRTIEERLAARAMPIYLPIGDGQMFSGIIDLIKMKGVIFDDSTFGAKFEEIEIPKDLMEEAIDYRHKMIETLSEYDDVILEKYVDGQEIEVDEIKSAIRKCTLSTQVTPVLCGSAFKNKGVQHLLDAVIDFLPSPMDVPPIRGVNPKNDRQEVRKTSEDEPFAALAFKISADPYVGKLTYFRVYSGRVKAGQSVYNVIHKKHEKLARILLMSSNKREDLSEVKAGDIAAAVGFRFTRTGDSLTHDKHPILLETMQFPEPVMSIAIEPKTKADQEKLEDSLQKLAEEDPTFQIRYNEETGQTLISGMGELHLDIIIDRLVREFRVKANVGKPQVAYKETITKQVRDEGSFSKQTSAGRQYAVVVLEVEPNDMGKGFEFESKVSPAQIPPQFIKPIADGVKEAMLGGVLLGYQMIDMRVRLVGGSFDESDSTELAFKIAASLALRNAAMKAESKILEPIMKVVVNVPDEYLGDVVSYLNTKRAKISGINASKNIQEVTATVPLSEMFGYATELRSVTQGRAISTMQFSHYDQIPAAKAAEIFEGVAPSA